MKLEFSYLKFKKHSLSLFVIISFTALILLLVIYFLIGDNPILNIFLSFSVLLFISVLIAYLVYKDYPKVYFNIINNGNKIKGEITGCYKRTIRARMTYLTYGEIWVSVDYGVRSYCFKDIVYNKKFKKLKFKVEEIWNKKKNNWSYRGRLEIDIYVLDDMLAADLDSIKYVEE